MAEIKLIYRQTHENPACQTDHFQLFPIFSTKMELAVRPFSSLENSNFMILGLTGAIGSGKSTVMSIFARLGAQTYDADALCHRFYEDEGSVFVRRLADRWGDGIFDESGRVSRRKIGEIVFADPVELDFLTGLMYPELRIELEGLLAQARRTPGRLTVFEIPLLFESGWEAAFDAVLTVWTDPALRRERLRQRGLSDAEMERREARQWDPVRKLEAADFAVINNGPEAMLIEQCEELIKKWKELEHG